MQFDYLLMAESANAADGKMNALGIGIRILTIESLPGVVPFAIIGAVSSSVDEAGSYQVELDIVRPNGERERIVEAEATFGHEDLDPRLPSGLAFTVTVSRPLVEEGVHSIEARVGDVAARYDFAVKSSQRAAAGVATGPLAGREASSRPSKRAKAAAQRKA